MNEYCLRLGHSELFSDLLGSFTYSTDNYAIGLDSQEVFPFLTDNAVSLTPEQRAWIIDRC
jgi:hypothetical protein